MTNKLFSWLEQRIDPYPDEYQNAPLPEKFFPFLWACTLGVRKYLVIAVVLTAVTSAMEAYIFNAMGSIVNWINASTRETFFTEYQSSLMFLVFVLLAHVVLVSALSMLKHQILIPLFPMRLRWRFHNLFLQQSLDFFSSEFSGKLTTKVLQTAWAVRDFFLIIIEIIINILVYFITISVLLGATSPLLLVPLFIWLTLFVLSIIYYVPRLGKTSQETADARSLITGHLTDTYTNIQTVKLFAHSQQEREYSKESMNGFLAVLLTLFRITTSFEICLKLLSAFLFIGVLGTAIYLWQQNQIEVGVIAAALAMLLRLNSLSDFIMWQLAGLFENVGTIQDGKKTLSRPVLIQDVENASSLQLKQGEIRFDHVNFSYSHKQVFKDLSFTIKAGEKIGVVGRSGAGKSTLIQLLLRFYDIQQGRILIDGQDISQVKQESLRHHIALVTQDTSLLHRTIKENIRYGRIDASDDAVNRVIGQAHVQDFLPHLIDQHGRIGLDAEVGERGVKLSGGQRQRIAIARVLLKNAPILILDEATSALDSDAESVIQSNLQSLMQGKTVIAIAHRLSTIAQMDRIVVFDQGQIVEQGSHTELLEQNGIYANLWQKQTGGFIVE
ncbi:ABC transporter ATP-binding protein [Acinetobacter apis]|uniref:ATP-binding cassette, subfamily B, multidrug efflux pump n=1 Tax=Acinetobacter apis TaxID=1229165 RepID=A0A217EDR7_9GAMM|nr:ABC transporter ATP-binding protein [Acinetobacter apis]SNQ28402.1 ATP-binding cassette, subfamily B, multidrug efflux pump [Acinetobacter apis]